MLEKEWIQSRRFKNTVVDQEVIGFQFDIRLMYYRGLWLSQLRPIHIKVDGEAVRLEDISWEINGKLYKQDELKEIGDIQWNVLEPASIHVNVLGGLTTGYHDIEVDYRFSSSYMPPNMDEVLSYGNHKRKLLLVS